MTTIKKIVQMNTLALTGLPSLQHSWESRSKSCGMDGNIEVADLIDSLAEWLSDETGDESKEIQELLQAFQDYDVGVQETIKAARESGRNKALKEQSTLESFQSGFNRGFHAGIMRKRAETYFDKADAKFDEVEDNELGGDTQDNILKDNFDGTYTKIRSRYISI